MSMKSKLTYYLVAFGFVAMVGLLNLHTTTNDTNQTSQEASLFSAIKNFFFPPEWSPEDCPQDDGEFGFVYNGGFEFGVPNNTEYSISNVQYNVDSETICGWVRSFQNTTSEFTNWDYGTRYFSLGEGALLPHVIRPDIYNLTNDNDNQRFVGLSVSEHLNGFQSHDYVRQEINTLQEGETYTLNFDFSVESNTSWPWPPQVGGLPNLGVAVLFLSDQQMDTLILSGEEWLIGQYGIYFQDELRDYASPDEFLNAIQVLSESENIEVVYLSETNEYTRTVESGDIQQFSQTFTAPANEYNNLVIFPVGYSPDYDASTLYKAKAVLTLDNITIESTPFTPIESCEIIFQGFDMPVYITQGQDLVELSVGQTVNLSDISFANQGQANNLETGVVLSSIGDGMFDFDTVNPADTLSAEDVYEMFSFVGVQIESIFPVSGGHVLATLTCVESCAIDGDLDLDGVVSTSDFIAFNSFFGTICETPGCEGDFNLDGLVTVSDLIILLNNFDQSCAEISFAPDYTNVVSVRQSAEMVRFEGVDQEFNFVVDIQTPGLREYIVSFENLFSKMSSVSNIVSTNAFVEIQNTKVIIPHINPGETVRIYSNIIFDQFVCDRISKLPRMLCK